MKLAFLQNRHTREHMLCSSLRSGMAKHGDKLEAVPYDDQPRDLDCDVIAFIGVKCREWYEFCTKHGRRFLYFDKGYFYPKEKHASSKQRVLNCWRVSVDTNQPLAYLAAAEHSSERWDAFGPQPMPWRQPTPDGHILIAGSSPKFHQFHGLPDPTAWAKEIVKELRQHTQRPIHYRPKPSWWIRSPEEAVPIDGAEFVPTDSFEERLHGAHAVVTYGSNAALIGMLSGIPAIILGNGVMRVISSTDLDAIEDPYLASEDDRLQLLANLAWSQFTLQEFANGLAWNHIRMTLL